jgi:hypothetical protein
MIAEICGRKGGFFIIVKDSVDEFGKVWLHTDCSFNRNAVDTENFYFNSYRWAKSVLCRVFNVVRVIERKGQEDRSFEVLVRFD